MSAVGYHMPATPVYRTRNDGKDKYRKREINRDEFFELLCDVAKEKCGRLPSQRTMHRRMKELRYTISLSAVQRFYEKLEYPDKKLVRDKDGDLIIDRSEWFPPDL